MKILGMSQADLANLTGIQRSQISNILNQVRPLSNVVLRKLLVKAFKYGEKDAEAQITQWKLEEAAERAKAAGVTGYDFGQKTAKPQMLLVSESQIKFCTNSFFAVHGEDFFLLSLQSGEMIDCRYMFSAKHFEDLYLLMGKVKKDYEHRFGFITKA